MEELHKLIRQVLIYGLAVMALACLVGVFVFRSYDSYLLILWSVSIGFATTYVNFLILTFLVTKTIFNQMYSILFIGIVSRFIIYILSFYFINKLGFENGISWVMGFASEEIVMITMFFKSNIKIKPDKSKFIKYPDDEDIDEESDNKADELDPWLEEPWEDDDWSKDKWFKDEWSEDDQFKWDKNHKF